VTTTLTWPGCPDGEVHGQDQAGLWAGLRPGVEEAGRSKRTGQYPKTADGTATAGRSAQIATVSQFLAGVPIDHFVEVTLVAFYQIAEVVQPITVCVNADTQDTYSGANFHKGYQQIDASQALAFVAPTPGRHPPFAQLSPTWTGSAASRPSSPHWPISSSRQTPSPTLSRCPRSSRWPSRNTAIDSGLNVLALAEQASSLTGGNVTFYTLPIDHFGMDPLGEDVNYVNLPLIQATVSHLLNLAPTPTATTAPVTSSPSSSATPQVVVDAINASGRPELVAELQQALTSGGFGLGKTSTADSCSGFGHPVRRRRRRPTP